MATSSITKEFTVKDKKAYIKMMKDECAMDVEVTVTLNEDEGKMLPPPPDGTPMISCSGGIIMEGHSGRLVLDNTFDKRLEVCFHDLKPVTRKCLFPSCYACLLPMSFICYSRVK